MKKNPSQIFFIRGYAKSGTNWLCNLLNLHPEISCKGEFHLPALFTGLKEMQKSKWSLLNQHNPDFLETAFYQMIKEVIVKTCDYAPVCGDRTPQSIRASYMPNVKHLYVSRDGRDVIVSWAYHAFNRELVSRPAMKEKLKLFKANPNYFEENKQELLSTESYVRGFSKRWNDQVVDDFKMMHAADKKENQLDYYWVRYEDLQKNTDAIRKKIYTYLGVKPRLAKPLGEGTTAGFKNVNNRSFFRKGIAGGWKEYFTEEQLNWFMEEASEAMALIEKPTSFSDKFIKFFR